MIASCRGTTPQEADCWVWLTIKKLDMIRLITAGLQVEIFHIQEETALPVIKTSGSMLKAQLVDRSVYAVSMNRAIEEASDLDQCDLTSAHSLKTA